MEQFSNDVVAVELRVGGGTAPKSLAGSIANNLNEGKTVSLTAIGHQAIGQAIKAVGIANSYVASHGYQLAVYPSFEVKHIDSGDGLTQLERTAMVLLLVKVRPF